MKKLLLFIFISGLAIDSYSQVHFGVTTAINSSFVLDKGLTSDPRYDAEMTYEFAPVGFSFGVDFTKSFGMQLESILANQGQMFEVLDAAKKVVGERNVDVSYLQLPLLFKFMSGSNNAARTNFSIGPQLSLLRNGSETLQYAQSIMSIPDEFASLNEDGTTYTITDPSTNQILTEQATRTEEGNYQVPAMSRELLSSQATSEFEKMKNKEFQIAASFGVDIDLGKSMYLSSLIRANYSLTDMRNSDMLEQVKNEGFESLFGKRSNVLVGVQLGINYVFGGTRSYKSTISTK
jgi:hypothetical protein